MQFSTAWRPLAILGVLLAGCGGHIDITDHTSAPLATPRLHVGPVQFMIPAGFTTSTMVAKDSGYAALVDKLNAERASCKHATEDVEILMFPGYNRSLAKDFAETMRDDYEDVQVHRRGTRSTNGAEIGLVDFEGMEVKGRSRVIVCTIPHGDRAYLLIFVCPAADAAAWLPIAEKVISSIRLRGQPTAQPPDGSGRGDAE